MNLKELIAALTKLETICGGETETEAMGVGLSIKTEITYEDKYSYSREQTGKRKVSNMITVSSLPLSQPYKVYPDDQMLNRQNCTSQQQQSPIVSNQASAEFLTTHPQFGLKGQS